MANFRFTKELTSHDVNIDLIKRIEDYLFNDIPKILNASSEEIKKNYTVKHTDDFGVETFSKISDYKNHIFQNDLDEIQLQLRHKSPKYLNLSLSFNSEWKKCKLAIEVEAENPRELTVSILSGIERILNVNKNYHHLFYASNGYLIIFNMFFSMFLFFFGLAHIEHSPRRFGLSFSLLGLIIIWYAVGRPAHPFTSFDSQINKRKRAWSKWFIFGFAGLLIFDTIFMILYKKFF